MAVTPVAVRHCAALLALVGLLALAPPVAGASEPPPADDADVLIKPRELKPDAPLPPVEVPADLGERRYSPREERDKAKEVLAFYAKESNLVRDPRLQARIEAMGHKIITAAHQLGPKQVAAEGDKDQSLTFVFRVLDSSDVNAFSAWNGNIFVTKAMVDFCQSDDELAGIIAHEVAHSTFHHLRELTERVQRYQQQQILAMVTAALLGVDVAKAGIMAQYLYLAVLNGHSVENESESDLAGCLYAYRAGYNPVGLITVFERLHRWQRRQPMPVDLGLFQTHPWSDERARALEKQIRGLGLPVNRRDVLDPLTAAVTITPATAGQPRRVELMLGGTAVLQVAGRGQQSAEQRAGQLAVACNEVLAGGVRSVDLRLVPREGHYEIQALRRFQPVVLLDIVPADAEQAGQPLDKFAQAVYNRVSARCRQDELNNGR